MTENEIVTIVVYDAVDVINALLTGQQKLEKSPGCILFGEGGVLDSLGLVNLIVATEERLSDVHGISVTIADERAMSQKNSPFLTIGSFVNYVSKLVEEKTDS